MCVFLTIGSNVASCGLLTSASRRPITISAHWYYMYLPSSDMPWPSGSSLSTAVAVAEHEIDFTSACMLILDLPMRLMSDVVSLMNHKEVWGFCQSCPVCSQSAILSLRSPLQSLCHKLKAQHNVLVPSKSSMDESHTLCKV